MFWLKLLQATWMGLPHRTSTQPSSGDRSRPNKESIALLLITQDDALRHSLCALGHVYRWEVISATTRDEAIAILKQRQMPLVICDEEAPEDWRKTVRTIAFLPQSTCILLASRSSSVALQRELGRHHGYNVIAKPLRFQEVADRVSFAWAWYTSGCASWWGPPPC
jgi:DNA-binding response OmpR family regulator